MNFHVIWEYRAGLLEGLQLTVWLTAVSIVGSLVLGTAIGCFGTLSGFLPKRLARVYVEALRNVPMVVKLFFLYFALGLDAIPASIISLVLHQSSYIADVTGAGLRSIPREQQEAARALGHSYSQVFIYVLLPQALRIIIPPLTNQFIEVLKNSSVVMLIALEELTFQTQNIEHLTFRGFEAATAVTVLYLGVALAIVGVVNVLKRLVIQR